MQLRKACNNNRSHKGRGFLTNQSLGQRWFFWNKVNFWRNDVHLHETQTDLTAMSTLHLILHVEKYKVFDIQRRTKHKILLLSWFNPSPEDMEEPVVKDYNADKILVEDKTRSKTCSNPIYFTIATG